MHMDEKQGPSPIPVGVNRGRSLFHVWVLLAYRLAQACFSSRRKREAARDCGWNRFQMR